MEPSDEELVRRFRRGDQSAFEEVVERWNAPLYRLAYRMTGEADAARDVRQMALLKTYDQLDSFEGRSRLSTWLYRLVLNLCRDRGRREAAQQRLRDGARERLNGHAYEETPECIALEREVADRVASAVLSLPAREREVVVLRHYHDLPFPAISEIVGAPVTTVKSRATKGLSLLRTRLSDLR